MIEKTLSNGVKCCVFPKKDYIEKEVMIAFKYGSADIYYSTEDGEEVQPQGTAHFIEHKMFEDEQGDIYALFSKNGANANAFTNEDTTAYYFTCAENFDENTQLLFKMVNSFHVTDESVEREKNIILQEINMYADDADWQSYFGLLKGMYSKNAVRNDIAGTEESISKINCDILKKSYNTFYTADNAVLIAAGDIDPDDFFEKAEKGINLPQKCTAKRHFENDEICSLYAEKYADAATPVFNMGLRFDKQISAHNICTADIVMQILAGKSSAFYERAYNKGLLNAPPSLNSIWGRGVSAGILSGYSSNSKKLREYIAQEIEHYKAYSVSDDYIRKIAQKLRLSAERSFNSISAVCAAAANCFSKNTEMLDIYEKYGKINIRDIDDFISNINTDNIVLSVCGQ